MSRRGVSEAILISKLNLVVPLWIYSIPCTYILLDTRCYYTWYYFFLQHPPPSNDLTFYNLTFIVRVVLSEVTVIMTMSLLQYMRCTEARPQQVYLWVRKRGKPFPHIFYKHFLAFSLSCLFNHLCQSIYRTLTPLYAAPPFIYSRLKFYLFPTIPSCSSRSQASAVTHKARLPLPPQPP
jgi:hypothetical protein